MPEHTVTCYVDGARVTVPDGASVARAVLDQSQSLAVRRTRLREEPRGLFCGIGACYDCLVFVDGAGPLRSCLLTAEQGMDIRTSRPEAPHD